MKKLYLCTSIGFVGQHVQVELKGNRVKIPDSSRCCEFLICLRHHKATGVTWEGIVNRSESEDLPSVYNEIMPAANGQVCDLIFSSSNMCKGATRWAYCICKGRHMAHRLYAVGGSWWHSLVVYVTENDYSQTINLHSVMKKISACCALRDYVRPSLEVVCVEVERGFAISNNQEPSPWEDM